MNGLPEYLREKSIKSKANDKESKVYKHIVSGALDWKGDFSTENSCIDNKSTEKKSIRITEKMLDKLIYDTVEMGKENSVLVIDLPTYYVIGRVIIK